MSIYMMHPVILHTGGLLCGESACMPCDSVALDK